MPIQAVENELPDPRTDTVHQERGLTLTEDVYSAYQPKGTALRRKWDCEALIEDFDKVAASAFDLGEFETIRHQQMIGGVYEQIQSVVGDGGKEPFILCGVSLDSGKIPTKGDDLPANRQIRPKDILEAYQKDGEIIKPISGMRLLAVIKASKPGMIEFPYLADILADLDLIIPIAPQILPVIDKPSVNEQDLSTFMETLAATQNIRMELLGDPTPLGEPKPPHAKLFGNPIQVMLTGYDNAFGDPPVVER
jgi:hypothetical protein